MAAFVIGWGKRLGSVEDGGTIIRDVDSRNGPNIAQGCATHGIGSRTDAGVVKEDMR